MASGNVGDVQYGRPYTGVPAQRISREGQSTTVLDMYRKRTIRITQHSADAHYVNDGGPYQTDMYHE